MAKRQTTAGDMPCPCGSACPYAVCCGPYLARAASAPDAEALMRSRYTAYTRGDEAYLLATWHPETRPASLKLEDSPKWLGLRVICHEQGSDTQALVEFVARYKIAGRAQRMHETSRFVREGGRWLYVEGSIKGEE